MLPIMNQINQLETWNLQFYCSVIRPTLEYGDVLWHGGLTNSQSENIERIQKRAFRIDYIKALNFGARNIALI